MQDWGPGTVVAASSVLHLNFRGTGYRNGGKLQAPVLNILPPCPLAAPEGGGGAPRVLTQYQKLRLLTAAGMEEPAEQGGSDGYGRGGGDVPGRRGRGHRGESEGRVRVAGSRKRELRDGVREGEPGI